MTFRKALHVMIDKLTQGKAYFLCQLGYIFAKVKKLTEEIDFRLKRGFSFASPCVLLSNWSFNCLLTHRLPKNAYEFFTRTIFNAMRFTFPVDCSL